MLTPKLQAEHIELDQHVSTPPVPRDSDSSIYQAAPRQEIKNWIRE